jgi:hypothetical protein
VKEWYGDSPLWISIRFLNESQVWGDEWITKERDTAKNTSYYTELLATLFELWMCLNMKSMNRKLSVKMFQIFSFKRVSVLYNEKLKFSFQRKFQLDLQIIGKRKYHQSFQKKKVNGLISVNFTKISLFSFYYSAYLMQVKSDE